MKKGTIDGVTVLLLGSTGSILRGARWHSHSFSYQNVEVAMQG